MNPRVGARGGTEIKSSRQTWKMIQLAIEKK